MLANDLKKEDFKVVSLHPGFVATDMGANASHLMSAIRPGKLGCSSHAPNPQPMPVTSVCPDQLSSLSMLPNAVNATHFMSAVCPVRPEYS